MAVYVDQARIRFGRMVMCHMVADSLDELHTMAEALGLKREWFQPGSTPHYDLCTSKRTAAMKKGVVVIGRRDLVKLIRRYGNNLPSGAGLA